MLVTNQKLLTKETKILLKFGASEILHQFLKNKKS